MLPPKVFTWEEATLDFSHGEFTCPYNIIGSKICYCCQISLSAALNSSFFWQSDTFRVIYFSGHGTLMFRIPIILGMYKYKLITIAYTYEIY